MAKAPKAAKAKKTTKAEATTAISRTRSGAKAKSVKAARKPAAKESVSRPAPKPPARREARKAAVPVPRSILRVKLTLDALFLQTNINGPHTTSSEVKRFRADPSLAIQDPELFGLVSNLAVSGWYPGVGRPDKGECDRLWVQLRASLGRRERNNPGGWDGSTAVITLALKADKP
jgi:hypothetical protein